MHPQRFKFDENAERLYFDQVKVLLDKSHFEHQINGIFILNDKDDAYPHSLRMEIMSNQLSIPTRQKLPCAIVS